MRAILTLFMVAKVTDGGLGLDVATAAAIYGFYTAAVFFMGIPEAGSPTGSWASAMPCSRRILIAMDTTAWPSIPADLLLPGWC